MASSRGKFHHKLVRELLFKYLVENDNDVAGAVNLFQVCERTIRNWKTERAHGQLEDSRLTRKVQSWKIYPNHFEYLLVYLETEEPRLFQEGL